MDMPQRKLWHIQYMLWHIQYATTKIVAYSFEVFKNISKTNLYHYQYNTIIGKILFRFLIYVWVLQFKCHTYLHIHYLQNFIFLTEFYVSRQETGNYITTGQGKVVCDRSFISLQVLRAELICDDGRKDPSNKHRRRVRKIPKIL